MSCLGTICRAFGRSMSQFWLQNWLVTLSTVVPTIDIVGPTNYVYAWHIAKVNNWQNERNTLGWLINQSTQQSYSVNKSMWVGYFQLWGECPCTPQSPMNCGSCNHICQRGNVFASVCVCFSVCLLIIVCLIIHPFSIRLVKFSGKVKNDIGPMH